MILYIENPKDVTRKLLELITEYCKVVGYKINTNKFDAFLYTNNKLSERNKENNPIPRNKSKEVKDLYLENYQTLIKETENDINRWKHILCSWIGKKNQSLLK